MFGRLLLFAYLTLFTFGRESDDWRGDGRASDYRTSWSLLLRHLRWQWGNSSGGATMGAALWLWGNEMFCRYPVGNAAP